MSDHEIVLDGRKYETQPKIDKTLQRIVTAVREIYGMIGVFGTRFRDFTSYAVDNYLGAIEEDLKQLRAIQKQLRAKDALDRENSSLDDKNVISIDPHMRRLK